MCNSCSGCPINITTEYGDMANAAGCLPSYADAIKWYNDTGKVWACHETPTKPCTGFIHIAKKYGTIIKVDKQLGLITEKHSLEDIYNTVSNDTN